MSAPVRFPRFFVTSPGPCPYLPGKTERKVFTELNGNHADELNEALGRIRPNATQRRILRRNADLVVSACRPWSTSEQYDLLRRYLAKRHPDGGMVNMDDMDYADMVEQSPVRSHVVEYRTPTRFGRLGELVGACLTDQQSDGVSMIYSFYDPDLEGRSGLGNYIIMDHILRAKAAGLPYVYLGYWVNGAARMQYKTRYRPLERLGPDGWELFDPDLEG